MSTWKPPATCPHPPTRRLWWTNLQSSVQHKPASRCEDRWPAQYQRGPCCHTQWHLVRSKRHHVTAAAGAEGKNGHLAAHEPGTGTKGLSALQSSLQLARARQEATLQAKEGKDVLLQDPYAAPIVDHICQQHGASAGEMDTVTQLKHVLTTRYIDETLLAAMAATNINTINKGDYRQVVLVGDALDTRPFRLPWPEGTLIFLVAPRHVHEAAAAAVKACNTALVPRGCLLRRVPADPAYKQVIGVGEELPSFLPALESAGYQANKLSVWSVQGLVEQQPSRAAVQQLLTDICNAAAFNSLVLGELPAAMTRTEGENLLAEFGLLSTVLDLAHEASSYGRWTPQHAQQLTSCYQSKQQGGEGSMPVQPWLFTSQQLRLSLAEMGVYEAHVAVANETDEDFFGNFS